MKTFFLFLSFPILLFSCSKQPMKPFSDDEITFRVDATLDSITGDTIFALFIPNAFTPNGDGINDYFGPHGIGISSGNYTMRIFNRWDNIIFETDDLKKGWNGRIGRAISIKGSYEYSISLDDIFGGKHRYVGSVLIIH